MKKADVMSKLLEFCKKYDDLVWFARKDPAWMHDGHPSMPGMVEVIMKYPKESKELGEEDGDWHHGFNSGCLAAFRLAIGLLECRGNGQDEIDNFPELHT